MREFISEIKEEFFDFIEDYNELIGRRTSHKKYQPKPAVIKGELTFIRPAYLFAERVENLLKIVFGVSVLLSAITSTFVGFASLSGLVETLIESIAGRLTLFIVGLSYVIVAVWKTLHLNKPLK
jgi:hypothetical protein